MSVSPEDIRSLIYTYADRADKALIESQAAAIEGNLERSQRLQAVATEYRHLLTILLDGEIEDELEDGG